MVIATFWKSDFAGDNLAQLREILKDYAVRGTGCWFKEKTNFIQACVPGEDSYEWIMTHVANYGDINRNK